MASALYNRDTLALIRGLTNQGKGVHAIACKLEWEPEQVRAAGKRHGIPLIEDVLGKPKKPAPVPIPEPVKPSRPEPVRRLDPVNNLSLRGQPKKRTAGLKISKVALTKYPRNYPVHLNISTAAREALAAIGLKFNKSIGAVIAVAVDHGARSGKIEAVLQDAFAEIEAQP